MACQSDANERADASEQSNAQSRPLLALLQLTDSALPIGAYSHSWGLETFVQNGTIDNAETAASAVANLLNFSLAPREGVAAALAYRYQISPNRVNNRNSLSIINSYLSASLWVKETHEASLKMGERLLRLAESLGWCDDLDFKSFNYSNEKGRAERDKSGYGSEPNKYTCHHSVAMGFVGAKLGIDINDLLPAYLLSSVAALVAALVKLVPLGHTDGQRILAGSHAQIAQASRFCLSANLEDLGGFAPLAEWGSVAHQSLYTRLFQS